MFDVQRRNYDKYAELSESKLQHMSALAVNKFKSIEKKSNQLRDRMSETINDHRDKNFDRFHNKSVNYDNREQDRLNFLKSEDKRHNSRIKARDKILNTLAAEHDRKKEMNKLRYLDAYEN